MFHARLFKEQAKFRDTHFRPTRESLTSIEKSEATPYLDGRTDIDRPLFVQFCANKADDFFEAAQYVAPYCDAVDLNLGCPQGIAKSGGYGAFLQEDWETIRNLIQKLRDELDVPVTAKFRILDTKEKTLDYAKMILEAGASIITVHGRQRHQKGHNTGTADWEMIRYLRDNLPSDTVLFANGNILNSNDLEPCLDATHADGVMSAEGNLSDPTIFAEPPKDIDDREYWRDPQDPSIAGYRIDGVFRRYMDLIHRHVLEQEPPRRSPLYVPGEMSQTDAFEGESIVVNGNGNDLSRANKKRTGDEADLQEQKQHQRSASSKHSKKQKTKRNSKGKDLAAVHNPNLKSMQGHLFQLLRSLVGTHIPIRDALARSRAGDIEAFEHVLALVEEAVREGLDEEYANSKKAWNDRLPALGSSDITENVNKQTAYIFDTYSSEKVRERCRRPFWVCQPHIRPSPEEAFKIGAMTVSSKDKTTAATRENGSENAAANQQASIDVKSQAALAQDLQLEEPKHRSDSHRSIVAPELPKDEALTCG